MNHSIFKIIFSFRDIYHQPRLCIYAVLQGRLDEVFASIGICCSSWVVASRGSTGRSFITPMGHDYYPRVAAANKMVSRTAFDNYPSSPAKIPSMLPPLMIFHNWT